MFSDFMILAIFYTAAILLSPKIGLCAMVFLTLFVLIAGLVRIIARKSLGPAMIIAAIALSVGTVRYYGASENRLVYEFPDKYVTVTGMINSQPSASNGTYKNRYIMKADSLSYLDENYKIDTNIILNTKETLKFGDEIIASGFLSEIDGIDNEFEYDFSLYYKSKGIYAHITAQEIHKTGEKTSLSPSFLAGKLRSIIANHIDEHFKGNSAAYLKAITVGDKSGFSRDYINLLVRTGVYRCLYAPFVHMTLIFLLAGLLCTGKKNRDYAATLLLIFYALFNSTSSTIIKAAAVSGLFIFRKNLLGFASKADVLSVVVLVMTLVDPLLCFNSGFMMSVISTLLMYLFFPTIYQKIAQFFSKRHIKSLRIKQVAAIWVVFLIATLPFSAYYYNGISVYASVLLALLTPLILVVIVLSPIMLACLAFLGTAPVTGSVIGGIITLLEKLPYIIQKLPFCYLTLKTPSLLGIIIFYLGWWIFLRGLKGLLKTQQTKILAVVMCGFIISSFSEYSFNTLSIYFVNVGQGDGAVLHTTAGDTVLIDGGGSADYQTGDNIGERVYLPYLTSHGFTNIDAAIVSHYHKDHVEGIIAAAENLKINTLIMPDSSPDNEYRLQLEEIARKRNIKVEYLMETDEIRFKSGLTVKFLAPDQKQLLRSDLNDTSLVAEVRYGEFCALFTGDSTDDVNDSYPADIDLLKVAHHGSATGSKQDYVDYVSPEYAVISVGKDNTYGHPNSEVVQRLETEGAEILRTDKLGDIRFKVKKSGKLKYSTLKGGY